MIEGERVADLVELPRRVIQQPTPDIFSGGDCGACVLGGLLEMSLADVYAKLQKEQSDGKVRSFEHYSMIEALRRAKYDLQRVDKYIEEMPQWTPVSESFRAFGNPSWMNSGAWWKYLTMALEAGYYAITTVVSSRKGPLAGGTDHWVMLCGTRVHYMPHEYENDGVKNKSEVGSFEVLVSCSSRKTPAEEWVECGDFLRERGGFFLFLVKPKP